MDHARGVGKGDGFASGEEGPEETFACAARLGLGEERPEGLASDEAHRVVGGAVCEGSGVVNGDDARMFEAGRDPSLPGEAGQRGLFAILTRMKLFEGDIPSEDRVMGDAHHPHTPRADQVARSVACGW
jgi:hypothetical protein